MINDSDDTSINAEALRRCAIQERALERINTDFAHLVSLVELALTTNDGGNVPNGGASSFAGLLDRLRTMVSSRLLLEGPSQSS